MGAFQTFPIFALRVIIEGLKRVRLSSLEENGSFYQASYQDILISPEDDDKLYFDVLVKALENYISKVPYMGNAIMSQLSSVETLNDLCDLIVNVMINI